MIIKADIKQVYELFPDFDKRFKLKNNYTPYVLFKNEKPVSCLCVALEGKQYAKIHAAFTPVRYRRKGYFEELLRGVLPLYRAKTIRADCLPASFGVFCSCGFTFLEKKHCNNYTLYKTIKEKDDDVNG